MSMKDTAKGLGTKLKLDSHHAIWRFGVLFGALCVSALVLLVATGGSAAVNTKAKTDTTALYTTGFTTSKTQLTGTVDGVYVNPEKTRTLVLMNFGDTASSTISANAENYQAFVTGSDTNLGKQALRTKLDGEIVVFGSTGYMGLVLDSNEPFEQQIIMITMRANAELVYKNPSELSSELDGTSSFAQYDQWRIGVNPGASGATVTEALSGKNFDPTAAFADIVSTPEEQKVRDEMDQQLAKMSVDETRIAEYTSEMARVNVDGVRIVPPTVPKQIAGDQITGEPAKDGKPSTQALKTDWVSPNGFDFDWRNGSVKQGYLNALVPDGESYVTYLAKKAAAKDETGTEFSTSSLLWKLTDGTDLMKDYTSSDTGMKPLTDVMNNLSQAYQDYYSDKVKYQVDMYSELLGIEVSLRNADSGKSVNDGDKAVQLY